MESISVELVSEECALWGFRVNIPNEVAQEFVDGNDRRVIAQINEKHSFQCALLPNGRGDWFININQKRQKQFNLLEGQYIQVILEKDKSEYGLPVPEELYEFWNQDPEFSSVFHSLTKGKQRSLIHWVDAVKSPEKRVIRSWVLAEHLKSRAGELDFRALIDENRAQNQREKF